jgi:hypothetical protein
MATLYTIKDTSDDSAAEGAATGAGSTSLRAPSRLGLFPPTKTPAEQLELLMSKAFYVRPNGIIFDLIIRLLEKHAKLVTHFSNTYKCNPLELALRLNIAHALDIKITLMQGLGCPVRPEYRNLLPQNIRKNKELELATTTPRLKIR